MDNLTHSLTGLMLSRAGFNRIYPRASALLIIAANIPDCDAISALGGAGTYFQFHRGLTHAVAAVPFMAVLPVLIMRLLSRRQPGPFPWLKLWLISLVGVATHPLLDATNPYAIRLWLPFDYSWPMLSITSVLDIWIWAILLLATLAPMLSSLVGSEIGERRKKFQGRGWAVAALTLLVTYEAGRWFLHQEAVRMQSGQLYNGETPRRVLAYPTSLSPLVWQGIVETRTAWALQTVDLRPGSEADPPPRVYYKPEATPAIEAAAQLPDFQRLMGFSRALYWRSTPVVEPEGATRITATDLFFQFTAEALLDRNQQVVESGFHFGSRSR